MRYNNAMKMQKLTKLAKIFKINGHNLYLVGGACRNNILGLEATDIDIASSLSQAKVKKLLAGSSFTAVGASKKLGTTIISCPGFSAEYTPFRKEKYLTPSDREPFEVSFNATLEEDAVRRDFTVNSIYYNPISKEIIDPFNGKKDCKKKVIRQIHDKVFDSDPLRILRMVRFASELNFKIDKRTFLMAKSKAKLVKTLSNFRLREELNRIINSPNKYGLSGSGHIKGVNNLINLGILPKAKLKAFKYSPSLLTLTYDLFKFDAVKAKEFLNIYALNNKEEKHILATLKFASEFNHSPSILTLVNHESELEDALKIVKNKKLLGMLICNAKENKIPLSISKLKINGNDLLALNCPAREISKVLDKFLIMIASGKVKNTKSALIKKYKEMNN